MALSDAIQVGVVLERRAIDNPWQDTCWTPVGVVPGAPEGEGWRELVAGDGWTQFMAGTFPLELHRKDTGAYKYNLEAQTPSIYVVLRPTEDDAQPVAVALVTASPYEAEAYMESGDELVEPVAMPEAVEAWVRAFVEAHHVEEVFRKRQRDKVNTEEHKFGQEPLVTLRARMAGETDD